MKAVEFNSTLKNRTIKIPNTIDLDLQDETQVRVIVLLEEEDNNQFKKLAKVQFLAGYSDADDVYDNY